MFKDLELVIRALIILLELVVFVSRTRLGAEKSIAVINGIAEPFYGELDVLETT